MDRFLPYGRQFVEEDDIAAVAAVLRSDYLTTGPVVREFEQALAKTTGAMHAVVCNSGTAALHLSLLALGIGPGDRVVVPTLTFLATANAVRYVGAEVVFADVDPTTGLLSARSFENALSRADGPVKAVIPVHLNGQAADLASIAAVAANHDIAIVEDASHALGSRYVDNMPVGACHRARLCCFSFHPVKTIAMGEGGAVTTVDSVLAERLERFRSHGMIREPAQFRNEVLGFAPDGTPNPWYYEMPEPGFNYRASDINCALGLSQLRKLDRFAAQRAQLVARYDMLLAPLMPLVDPVSQHATGRPVWHLYSVLIDFDAAGLSRTELMSRLRAQGIGSQVHYMPVHRQPYYAERYGSQEFPGSAGYYRRQLSLPLYVGLQDEDIERVVAALQAILAR